MSTYVMSDIHGCFSQYQQMLELIDLQPQDSLWVLGDVVDRGPQPLQLLLAIMDRPNVHLLAGNHEVMAYKGLKMLLGEITAENLQDMEESGIAMLTDWLGNGADSTISAFAACDGATRQKILDYISTLEVFEEIEVAGKSFVLVHAGLGEVSEDKDPMDCDLIELLWERPDYSRPYYSDCYVITGHTPTMCIPENDRPGYIYKGNNHIAVDCGCSFPGGRLGCIRLEDMQEFYVEE